MAEWAHLRLAQTTKKARYKELICRNAEVLGVEQMIKSVHPFRRFDSVEFDRHFMTCRNPWSATAEVGEVYLLRGIIVSAFAHADWLAMELAVRLSAIPEYDFKKAPPSRTATRIKYLNDVAMKDGPLSPYRPLLEALINRLKKIGKLRNFFAHSTVQVLPMGWIVFEDYQVEGNAITANRKRYYFEELRRFARKNSLFIRACDKLYFRLNQLAVAPPIEALASTNGSVE